MRFNTPDEAFDYVMADERVQILMDLAHRHHIVCENIMDSIARAEPVEDVAIELMKRLGTIIEEDYDAFIDTHGAEAIMADDALNAHRAIRVSLVKAIGDDLEAVLGATKIALALSMGNAAREGRAIIVNSEKEMAVYEKEFGDDIVTLFEDDGIKIMGVKQ